jgi:2,3-bisphosphoglycerate-independent phosphoglycerate mutase
MLEDALAQAESSGSGFSYRVGSGGGRMYVTMDRYNGDWNIVKRGYDSMVHGKHDETIVPELGKNGYTGYYKTMSEWRDAVGTCFPDKTDQNYPPFVCVDDEGTPAGKIGDGDIVINFNYRGDRAIEISRAFTEGDEFSDMDRGVAPKVDYYGMLIYDNDVGIPKQSLVPNPEINNVMSEYLVASGVSMYAMSETHKYGHVTFFWNGNRSGYLDTSLEKYEEIKSDPATPEQIAKKPEMKAPEIADAMIAALETGKFKFLRANFANGDMAGHTGLIAETTQSVSIMDKAVGRVLEAVRAKGGTTLIVADHGNCEYMKDKKGGLVTSHSCNPVPFVIDDPSHDGSYQVSTEGIAEPGLTNVAATVCNLLGYEAPEQYQKTLLAFK